MAEKSILQQYIENRRQKSPEMKSRQKFINYSLKQKVIFILVVVLFMYVFCTIYNTIHMLIKGMWPDPITNPLDTILLTVKFNLLAIIIIFLMSYPLGRIAAGFFRESYNKDSRGYKMSRGLESASSRFLDMDTKRNLFLLTDEEHAYGGTIIGEDKKTKEVILIPHRPSNPNYALANQHIAIMGSSGMRKTSSVLINLVYNTIAAKFSAVCADPKMEISEETLAAAIAAGYRIFFFNLLDFDASDGWDVLKLLREADDPISTADLMTNVIITNSGMGNGGDAFWPEANYNCLKVHLLAVALAKGFVSPVKPNSKGNTRTMEALISLITSDDSEQMIKAIIEAGGDNGDKELLQGCFNIWVKHPQKDSIRSGLGTKLSIFQNKKLARILSEDEIDFKALNDEKTIIYLICSDQDTTYKSVLSLFCNFLFKEMATIADKKKGEKKLDRPLNIIFEEAKNIGKIVGIAQKVATIRSRGMNLIFAYQNIGQMQDDYGSDVGGKHEWETILTNCATKLFLGGDDEATLKYFSFLSGEMYVDMNSTTIDAPTLSPVKFSFHQDLRTTPTKIPVLRPDEIKTIKPSEILICPSNFDVTIENKFYYKKHPMYGYRLVDKNGCFTKFAEHPHVPLWRKKEVIREIQAIGGFYTDDIFDDELHAVYVKDFFKEAAPEDNEPSGKFEKALFKAAPFLFKAEEEPAPSDYRKSTYSDFLQEETDYPAEEETPSEYNEYYDDFFRGQSPQEDSQIFTSENSTPEESLQVKIPKTNADRKIQELLEDVTEWEF